MKLKFPTRTGAVAVTLLVSGTFARLLASDASIIRLPLQSTGVDPDASAVLISTLSPNRSSVVLTARRLTAGHPYTLTVSNQAVATLVPDSQGRVAATFSTAPRKNQLPLNFDPRGQRFSVDDGGTTVLAGTASGPGEPAGITIQERARLSRLAGSGEATVSYQSLANGRRLFTVKLERVSGTNWSVYVDGLWRGAIPVRGPEAKLVFDSAPGEPGRPGRVPLTFDPRGQVVDVMESGVLQFSGRLEAKAHGMGGGTNPGDDPAGPARIEVPLFNLQAPPQATAKAKFQIDDRGRRKFEVEIEDAATGSYALWIGDALVGNILVTSVPNGTEGKIEFEDDDDGGHPPLSFEPRGQSITIRRDGIDLFQRVFPAGN